MVVIQKTSMKPSLITDMLITFFFLTLLGRGDGALLSSTLGRATTGDGAGMVELLGGGGILQPLGHEDQIDLLERASAGLGAAEID